MSIESKVIRMVTEYLGVPESKVTTASNFIKDLGADSLDTLELTLCFEETFDIRISDDEADELHTIADVIKHIESKAVNYNGG